ncbi:sigma-70 family RNA polymerase sigma factor [Rhodococcoides kyotonense]|uniref:Sigma-70 family RNA polymerase sigma factor n=1 Tax=Rhodococcoides kyotonense TaxID=398843 RepID=A0A239MZC3_9NOCA|nr:sigma-70 family RNA polymerase sigma factor [Rhodococcus kyotonensis]SNT47298.1 hypothetical protein SAMN05421642_12427 [Rhodococcus kyotonensis]
MSLTFDKTLDADVNEEREPTAAEIDAWQREDLFVPEDEATDDDYPRMTNLSAGFIFQTVIRPRTPMRPEYVTIEMENASHELHLAVSEWNMLWESAQFRRRIFDIDDLPEQLGQLAELGDNNITLVPRTSTRYYEYAPLLHLLPRRTLEHFGLPLLRTGQWPFVIDRSNLDRHLPVDFEHRLARAWAWHIWPHLNSGSGLAAFTGNDPIRILAHNLDFWVPPVTSVMQDVLREFAEVDKGVVPGPVPLVGGDFLDGAVIGNPRMGGDIWRGKTEAAKVLEQSVQSADATGQLRGILDAVRSNRVQDDFSDRWSNAKEDFERKLYNKRTKVKVRFVELTDTIPVQGPESEVLGDLVTNDFLALLDERERQVVVLLSSGWTRQREIAEQLGYSNHSAISKRLTAIRKKAAEFFDE